MFGYRYDTETGLYYLQSRYYNPEWGRFINADSVAGSLGELLSHNVFAYCGNNPVTRFDPDGYDWMDNLISWMFGESGKKPSQSQKMWEAYFAGIQSAINNFAQEISSMVEGLCRSIASEERINEIVGACSEFNCFVAGTKIQTEDGIKSIENIKVGDEVYSENPETGEKEYKKVKQTFVHEVDTLVHVSIGDTKLDTTEGHKFWVVGKGWTEAKNLRQGDSLLESSGKIINVTDVHIERLKEKVKVYNFEVDDFHTYFVSNLGILVNNTCGPSTNINFTLTVQGKGQAPKMSTPNSIYEKLDNEVPGLVKSRTFYNDIGKPFSRQDFYIGSDPHTHNSNGVDLYDHEHIFQYNSKGQRTGEYVIPLFTQGY